MADTPAQVALDEREETPAEEFSRLVIEYNEGQGSERDEAWNFIADFACEYADAIVHGLAAQEGREAVAWIVANGARTKWRVWRDGFPEWTDNREEATRYARREDAEAVHADDEDAWTIEPFQSSSEPYKLAFPTMLRKMWSGGEVQQWLDELPTLYTRPAPSQPAAQVTDAMVTRALSAFEKDHPHNRAAMRAALTAAIGAGGQAVAVKPLEWESGVVDWAKPLPGMKYVACSTTPKGAWAWWLDDAPGTRAVFASETEAKAAAQADYERRIRSALSQPHPADERVVEALQARVQPWMMACFGPEISADKLERSDRFIEEALELVQSVGYPRNRIEALISYVYDREAGDPPQEVGGVMITLAAFCLAHDLDMHACGETELARIWTKVDKIRAKQAAKPTGSALPIPITEGELSDAEVERLADKIAADTFHHLPPWNINENIDDALHGAIQKSARAALLAAKAGEDGRHD